MFSYRLLCIWQGSESLASWKANLLFEPVKFEVNLGTFALFTFILIRSWSNAIHVFGIVLS